MMRNLKFLVFIFTCFSNCSFIAMQSGPTKMVMGLLYPFTKQVDASQIKQWQTYVASVGTLVSNAKNSALSKEYNNLSILNDAIINTIKFVKNSSARNDKINLVKGFFERKDLFGNKTAIDFITTIRNNLHSPSMFASSKTKEAYSKVSSLVRDLTVLIDSMQNDFKRLDNLAKQN